MEFIVDTEQIKLTAEAALKLLERVDLKGAEVNAYIAVNHMLSQLAIGELEITGETTSDPTPDASVASIGDKAAKS